MRFCKLQSDSAAPPVTRIFRSPKKGKYLVRNPLANFLLRLLDLSLGLFIRPNVQHAEIGEPRKILLANGAHLGDLLLSTVVIPVLKRAYPHAKIGFLVGSWAHVVVMKNQDVGWIHQVDHWKLNRSGDSVFRKIFRYLRTKRVALREIKEIGYDIAIDLYPYFPNMIPLLWRAKIPVRIAYASGGFGPLLTHSLEWENKDQSVAEYHTNLLRCLPIEDDLTRWLKYDMQLYPADVNNDSNNKNSYGDLFSSAYIVIHPGAGRRNKEWPLDRWVKLTQDLSGLGYKLVFTGSGSRECSNIIEITQGLANACTLCGELDWWEFGSVISGAILVVCLDSVAGHVAAAAGVPCVVLCTGMANPYHWAPLGNKVVLLTQETGCSPCYRSRGCLEMSCIREIDPDEVFRNVSLLLSEQGVGVA